MMSDAERERFDHLLEEVLEELPPALHALLEEAPLIVEDHPSDELKREMGIEHDDDLCGLHTGVPLTERSVEHHGEVEYIHIFRQGIIAMAGGWEEKKGQKDEGTEGLRAELEASALGTDSSDLLSSGVGSDRAPDEEDVAADESGPGGDDAIREEIRITVLHEIGHHFGLDEDDLAELGYE